MKNDDTPRSIKKLKALGKKGSMAFEVEHLLAIVHECEPEQLPVVEGLLAYSDWMTCEQVAAELKRTGTRYVPMASWRRLVLGCLAHGLQWLTAQALSRELESDLAVPVLAATKDPMVVPLLVQIADTCARDDRRDGEVLRRCVEELNLWGLPPKGKKTGSPALGLPENVLSKARELLESLIDRCGNNQTRVCAVYALRWFGDSSSITVLSNCESLPEPFSGATSEIIRVLRRVSKSR